MKESDRLVTLARDTQVLFIVTTPRLVYVMVWCGRRKHGTYLR